MRRAPLVAFLRVAEPKRLILNSFAVHAAGTLFSYRCVQFYSTSRHDVGGSEATVNEMSEPGIIGWVNTI